MKITVDDPRGTVTNFTFSVGLGEAQELARGFLTLIDIRGVSHVSKAAVVAAMLDQFLYDDDAIFALDRCLSDVTKNHISSFNFSLPDTA